MDNHDCADNLDCADDHDSAHNHVWCRHANMVGVQTNWAREWTNMASALTKKASGQPIMTSVHTIMANFAQKGL